MTNSRDSCSDSQNAPGLPWAWGEEHSHLDAATAAAAAAAASSRGRHLDVPLQVLLEGGLLDPPLQLLVVLKLRPQLL